MPAHRVSTPLRWSDMDAYGHVNNVAFLTLLEEARVVALAASGSDEGGSLVSTGLLVGRIEIEYLAPLVYRPAPVAIDIWVTRIGGASFDLGYQVLDEDSEAASPPVVYARAETTMVVYDLEAGHPRRITAEERQRLTGWLGDPVPFRRRRDAS